MNNRKRSSFTGSIGFVLAASGSAVGLGNIWRFPYLAAKDHGGVFILCYIILALTFGFALLTTEIAIGRKTAQSPLTAYQMINKKWGSLGILACLIPVIILPYYCTIGGWVVKYFFNFMTGGLEASAADGYFTQYITKTGEPVLFMSLFLALTAFVVYRGVNKGIEGFNKILMPILLVLIIGISIFTLTIEHTDESGIARTGLQGLQVYLVPDFSGMTLHGLLIIIMDAMGQLFFSISVSMGIMVAYGSYVKKETNLMKSINQIEIFDTAVALLAGLMIVPAVYVFMGTEGMSAGPGLMFISLPKIFHQMGIAGAVLGFLFFLMVIFAALTSAVSVMEAIVASMMDKFGLSRKKSAFIVFAYGFLGGLVVCLGYNMLYFEMPFPNGTTGQVLDLLDYISNSCLMPLVAFLTCILIGWIAKPKTITDEVKQGGVKFGRERLYVVMIKFVAPVLLFILLLQAFGVKF